MSELIADPVRAAIVANLRTIPGIGKVHTFERYAARNADLSDLYVVDGQLCGWFVRRIGVIENNVNAAANLELVRWQIRGYMALDDKTESELAFDGLQDAIRSAFKEGWQGDLNRLMVRAKPGDQSGIAVDDSGPVLFAGVLCHAAKLSLITRHYKNYTIGY